MAKDEVKEFDISIQRKFGGAVSTCNARASSAYFYYNEEQMVWNIEDPYDEQQCLIQKHDYTNDPLVVPEKVRSSKFVDYREKLTNNAEMKLFKEWDM